MHECIDPEIGNLLLGYEFNGLSEEETERFETHMIECRYCHDQFVEFASAIALLTSDADVRRTVETLAQETTLSSEPIFRRFWRYVWPDRPLVLRPAVAYIFILLLIIPAYLGVMRRTTDDIRSPQVIHLLPERSAGDNVLRLAAGQDGLLTFVVRGAAPGKSYTVSIETDDGRVVFSDDAFNSFDRFGTGLLLLPSSRMESGIYRLIIVDPQGEPPVNRQVQSFRIEK